MTTSFAPGLTHTEKEPVLIVTPFLKKNSSILIEKRQKLFRDVTKVEIGKVFNFDAIRSLSHMVFVDHPKKGKLLVNNCSPDFSLIPLKEWLVPFEAYLDKLFDFEVKYSHSNYAHFNICYKIQIPSQIVKKDMVLPTINVTYGYDSSSFCQVTGGLFRLICSNGLTVPVRGAEGINESIKLRRRHVGSFDSQALLDHLVSCVDLITEQFPAYIKQAEVLGDRYIQNVEQRFEEVIAATGYPTRMVDQAKGRYHFEKEMYYPDLPDNDWLVYNGLNYPLSNNWDTLRMRPEGRVKLDEKVFSWIMNN